MSKTYSFQEASVVLSHPAFGQYQVVGQGAGSVDIDFANDVSSHDLAADGKVMTSRIKAKNGTVSLNIQQISDVNAWLTSLYNYLLSAPATDWNELVIVVDVPSIGEKTTCTGCAFQKNSPRSYQAQGQQKTWLFMSENISMN